MYFYILAQSISVCVYFHILAQTASLMSVCVHTYRLFIGRNLGDKMWKIEHTFSNVGWCHWSGLKVFLQFCIT